MKSFRWFDPRSITAEQAFAFFAVSCGVLIVVVILFLIPSCVNRYLEVIEISSSPVKKGR